MQTYTIHGKNGASAILLGEQLANLASYLHGRTCAIVTDETVFRLYGSRFPVNNVIVIGTGERIKTLATVETIYQKFLEYEIDRSSIVVAIGGGIVCDIAGFAAATFMRGVAFGAVPTTLLAQVDASVGGKTGVNFQGYKNLVGVFAQPEFVLMDVALLHTLPKRELGCGFAEAIKHGAIADADLFAFMENQADAIQRLDAQKIERIIADSIRIKSAIVNQDEQEHGERRKLNFGHTFGHAVEKTLGLPHGEAVSIGMAVAAAISRKLGYLSDTEAARLTNLLTRFELPVQAAVDPASICEAIRKDKKRSGDSVQFVLLNRIGGACIQNITFHDLEEAVHDLY